MTGAHADAWVGALVVAGALTLGGIMGHRWAELDRPPECHEDEVRAVQHDPDPAHGLTWACENAEDYVARWLRKETQR